MKRERSSTNLEKDALVDSTHETQRTDVEKLSSDFEQDQETIKTEDDDSQAFRNTKRRRNDSSASSDFDQGVIEADVDSQILPSSERKMEESVIDELSSDDQGLIDEEETLSDVEDKYNITLVGSGQVSATLIFLLCESAKDIKLHNQQIESEEFSGKTPKRACNVNVLATKDSSSFESIRRQGIYMHYKEAKESSDNTSKTYEVAKDPKYYAASSEPGREGFFITQDKTKIPPSDFIIVAVPNVPGTYNDEFIAEIKHLVDHSRYPDQVRVVMAQNGIPASYIARQNSSLSRTSSNSQTGLSQEPDNPSHHTSLEEASSALQHEGRKFQFYIDPEYTSHVQEELKFLNAIGPEKVIITSVNLACQAVSNNRRADSSRDSREFYLSTPTNKVKMPCANTIAVTNDPETDAMTNRTLKELRGIFRRSRIGIQGGQDIYHEMFEKLQVNMINGICAITGLNIGQVLDHDTYSVFFSALMADVKRINNSGEKLRDERDMRIRLEGSRDHYTSMSQNLCTGVRVDDVIEGRKMEIDLVYKRAVTIAANKGYNPEAINAIIPILEEMEQIRDDALHNKVGLEDAVKLAREAVLEKFNECCEDINDLYHGTTQYETIKSEKEFSRIRRELEQQKTSAVPPIPTSNVAEEVMVPPPSLSGGQHQVANLSSVSGQGHGSK